MLQGHPVRAFAIEGHEELADAHRQVAIGLRRRRRLAGRRRQRLRRLLLDRRKRPRTEDARLVLLALMVGGELMGVLGAVLAVPVTAAISVIVDEIRAERIAPSVDAEDVVSDDVLPENGVPAEPAERTEVTAERREVEGP